MGSNAGNFLQGGSADDTIYVINTGDRISGGGGIDTAIATVDFTLPSDVENLTMNARWSAVTGVGNAGDNILTAQTSNVTLYGGGGNDVFVSAGGDTFVFAPGSGNSVVYSFHTDSDVVRLGGYGFDTFAKVQAAMSQQGGDTLLQLSPTEAILFKGVAPTQFTAADFQLSINTSALKMSFDDEFNTLKLQVNGDASGWATSYDWASSSTLSAHTITGESEIYVDPTFAGSGSSPLGLNPFSISNGELSITPSATPTADLHALWNQPYVSGLLTTKGSFEQTYGYFEIKADMPSGQGSFPAFWLLSADGKYNEIDVVESVNGQNQAWQHLHYTPDGATTQTSFESSAAVAGMSSGSHTYGVLWTPQTITWFIDGAAVSSTPTPAVMNSPMYMLVDYAVGGSWAGAPDGSALSPMTIDYVRAYSLADAPDAILNQASTATTSTAAAATSSTASSPPAPPAPAVSDAQLSIVANAASVDGTQSGYATFTVTRSGNLSGPATVDWTVGGSGSTPASAADFGGTLPSGTVWFGQGESTKTIWAPIAAQTSGQSDTFTVTLSDPTGASLSTASATEVITHGGGISTTVQSVSSSAAQIVSAGSAAVAAAGTTTAAATTASTTDLSGATVTATTGDDVVALSPTASTAISQYDAKGHDALSIPVGSAGFQLSGVQADQTHLSVVDASAWWNNISNAQVVRWTGAAPAVDSAAKVDGLLQAMPGNQGSGMFVVGYTSDDSHVAVYYDSDPAHAGGARLVATFDNLTSATALTGADFQIAGTSTTTATPTTLATATSTAAASSVSSTSAASGSGAVVQAVGTTLTGTSANDVFNLSPGQSETIVGFSSGHDTLGVPHGAGGFQLGGLLAGQTGLNMVDASAWWNNISGQQIVRWMGDASAVDSAAKVDGLLQAMPGNQGAGVFVIGYTPDHAHAALYYDADPAHAGGASLVATFADLASPTQLAVGDFHLFS